MELRDRHVVVTGGSRGIGEAIAREFAARGARVTVVARSEESLGRVAAEIGGHAIVADLTDDATVDSLIDRIEQAHGPVDVLVNNAGLETSTPFAVEDPREIRAVSRLNLETSMLLTRHALPGMLSRGSGHIVMVSSLAGTAGFPGMSPYCATKAGVLNFAASLERELRGSGVGVTVLAPGPVDTRMWDSVEDSPPTVQQFVRRFQKLRLIPKVDASSIARRTVDAVEKGRRYVRHPRRLFVNFWLHAAPTRISNAAGVGLRFDPLDRGRRHN